MSRVSYCMENASGDAKLTEAVVNAIKDVLAKVTAEAGISENDILEIILVDNSIMHHLVLGIDPSPLDLFPFALAINNSFTIPASKFDIKINPGGNIYFLLYIAWRTLADALPERLTAGHFGTVGALVIGCIHPDTGKTTILIEPEVGGFGAGIGYGRGQRTVQHN